jgi:putative hydrolase of the HAD superfamily
MKRYEHIFFDLDHTLWDFERNSEQALQLIFGEIWPNGTPFNPENFIARYKEVNSLFWDMYNQGTMTKSVLRVKRFSETLSLFGIEDELTASLMDEAYLDLSPRQPMVVDGAMDVLEHLKSKGKQLHIITNGFYEVQEIKMRESGLAPFFEHIIISEVVGVNKPDPKVFLFAMQKAGVNPGETVMVGDNLEADIIGARGAGMDQVFFNPKPLVHSEEVTFEIRHLTEIKDIIPV